MNNYLKQTKKAISGVTGIDPSEVKGTDQLEGDLNVGNLELVEILENLEEEFTVELMEEKDKLEVVSDLVDLLTEKLE